ncbi:MAG TPA: hypothetical protein VMN76_02660, partial [Acidobacteriota bacterium]|nr:hypothetical protein [Acidobacteriota bacterium]
MNFELGTLNFEPRAPSGRLDFNAMEAPYADADEFAAKLKLFLLDFREGSDVPDRGRLDSLSRWQMRVSGGALLKFLRFVKDAARMESVPELKEIERARKRLVGIFDEPGSIAAHDIFRMFRPSSIWMSTEEWSIWTAMEAESDAGLQFHFRYWSWWSREMPAALSDDLASTGEDYWLHCEGYRLLAEKASRANHLWRWNGARLELVIEDIER